MRRFSALRAISLIFVAIVLSVAMAATGASQDRKTKTNPLQGWSAPLQSADIGNPAFHGSMQATSDGLQIIAGGKDIWGTADEFHFTYQKQNGNFDIVVRVRSLTAPQLYARAGIMAREDLSADSRHIFFLVFPDNRPRHNNTSAYELQFRAEKSGESKAIYPAENSAAAPLFPVQFPNAWLRLRRNGNEFTVFVSDDGKSWKKYASFQLALPPEVFLGLAATSHTADASVTATFSDLGNYQYR